MKMEFIKIRKRHTIWFLSWKGYQSILFDLGRKLYEGDSGPKSFYIIHGAGHNDIYIMGGRDYYNALDGFITETLKIPMTSHKN